MTSDKSVRNSIIRILSHIREKLDVRFREDFDIMLLQHYLFMTESTLLQVKYSKGLKGLFIRGIKELKSNWDLLNIKSKPDLIIWITEDNQLAQALPVARHLQSFGTRILFISSKRPLLEKVTKEGFNNIQFTLPPHSLESLANINNFGNLVKEVVNDSPNDKISGNNYKLLLNSYEFNSIYTKKLKKSILKILKKFKPKALLVGNDLPLEGRAFTYLCNKSDISTFMIQHGAIHSVEDLFSQHIVKEFMVFGEESKKVLLESGCSSKIIVTGPPYLDKVSEEKKGTEFKDKLNVLVGFSGPGHLTSVEHHIKSLDAVMNLVRKFPSFNFFFKLHPKDKISYYYDAIGNEEYPNIYFSLPGNNSKSIFDWISYCDIMITSQSTIAIEAMMYQMPVICLDLLGDYSNLTYVQQNAVTYINSKDQLETIFSRILCKDPDLFKLVNRNANNYVKRFYGNLDGKSSERCAQIIKASINSYSEKA